MMSLFYLRHKVGKNFEYRIEIQFQRKTFQCIVVLCGVEDGDNAAHNILTLVYKFYGANSSKRISQTWIINLTFKNL